MVGVQINSVAGLPSGLPVVSFHSFKASRVSQLENKILLYGYMNIELELLQFVLDHVEDKNIEPLLEVCDMVMMEFIFLFLFKNLLSHPT